MTSASKPRLVVFDVEGVLIARNRFIFEVGKTLGFGAFVKLLTLGFLYEVGILKLEPTLKSIYSDLKGVKLDALNEVFSHIPATAYLQSFFSQLKARNCKIALISSGVPTVLVEKLAATLCADYAYGVDTEISDGKLTGKIGGNAITENGKLKILYEIINKEDLQLSDCVIVADDRNNRCLFLKETLKIGFNPDFALRLKADCVVNGKLSRILPILDGKPNKRSFPTTNDFVRENLHASGIFMPVIAGLIGVPVVATIIIFIAIVYTISELYRLEGRTIPLVSAITRHAASQSELYGFAAAPLYFATGIVATLLLYPKMAAGGAIAMFCLGDSAASIFGGLISHSHSLPFNKGKTWEGSLAGFFFAFLGGMFFVPPVWALAGAAVAMGVEALPLPINDNLLIPVVTGATLTLLVA
jgi:phosphoserine phosphatase/dolichol kinase